MNWLVLVILVLSVLPLGVLVSWWRRSKRDDLRKAAAVSKMSRYVRGGVAAPHPSGPLHALAAGQVPVPLPRRSPVPVSPVPAMSALTVPLGRPPARRPVRQSPEPALSMIAPIAPVAPRRR